MKESKEGITEQQEEAVEYCDGPLLVIAGPGTGKTRVLIDKVLYLVTQKEQYPNRIEPNRILVSTFTIKAADELKDRLRQKLGDKVETMQISTIHSFCQKMLQTFPDFHNFGNVFQVLDELDQFMFVNKNIWNYGLKDYIKEIDVDELINFYNRATENDVDPQKLIDNVKKSGGSEKDIAIAKSYALYLAQLLNPNNTKLDFALLQRQFLHMLENHEEVLNKVRFMFDYILIDEYQDTNPIQDAIFHKITAPKYKIMVVGDEDQSIYGFRGASIENFRAFLQRYSNLKTCSDAIKKELEENFRSSEEIVDSFDNFMKKSRHFGKTIFTNNGKYSKPILLVSRTLHDEGKTVSNFIKKIVGENQVQYGDITILFKSVKYNSGHIQDALEKNKIPFITIGDSSLLSQEAIVDILILIGYITSIEEDTYYKKIVLLRNIFCSELLGLCEDSKNKISEKADLASPFAFFDQKKLNRLKIEPTDQEIIAKINDLKKGYSTKPIPLLKLFYKLLDCTGYHAKLFIKQDEESEIKIRNLAKFSVLLDKFHNMTNSTEFRSFLYHISTIPDNKMEDATSIENTDAVKLMTIHQAKGLEFPVVIMGNVTEKRYNKEVNEDTYIIDIPPELMLDKNKFNRAEELRRTFYVGLSRAQRMLILSTIDGPGSKPSPFIDEIGRDKFISEREFNQQLTLHYKPHKEKIKLSYSSISAYQACPFRFYLRDILNFQTPIAFFQEYGIIVHNALKKIHVLVKEGKAVTLQDIIQIVDTYCKDDESKKRWRDELITDMWNYYEKIPAFINRVVDVELPFSYICKDLVINGQVDLVIRNKDNDLEIIDFKSRHREGLKKMNVDTQLRMYNIVLNSKYGENIKRISAYTFKDFNQTAFPNSEEDLNKTKELIINIAKDMEKKDFKRNWKGQYCITTEGKCDFYGICLRLEDKNEQSGKN